MPIKCKCNECGKVFYHPYYKISICDECHKKLFKGYRPGKPRPKTELIVTPWKVRAKE